MNPADIIICVLTAMVSAVAFPFVLTVFLHIANV